MKDLKNASKSEQFWVLLRMIGMACYLFLQKVGVDTSKFDNETKEQIAVLREYGINMSI